MTDYPDFETINLEQFKLVFLHHLSGEYVKFGEAPIQFGEPPEVTIHTDIGQWGARECAIRLVQKIWGLEVQRQECKWPADWWQAFKERWYPEWAKKRWPVRYEQYVITARELYPQVSLPPDRYNAVIAIDKHRYWAEFDDA